MSTQNTALGTLHDAGQFTAILSQQHKITIKKREKLLAASVLLFRWQREHSVLSCYIWAISPIALCDGGRQHCFGRSMPTLSIIGLQFPTKMASWSARFLKHYVTTSLRKYTEITYSTNVWLCDMIARHLDL